MYCSGACLGKKELKLHVVRCVDVTVLTREPAFSVLVKEVYFVVQSQFL